MKVVLFCGGLGTRLREFSETIPKPLVPIGTRPVLWHLMRYYAHFGHNQFILCLGYRGDQIKSFFVNYDEWQSNDFTMRGGGKEISLHKSDIHDWEITFVDTGLSTNIGQRLARVRAHLGDDEYFLANYADGLTDLDLNTYIDAVRRREAWAGMLAVRTWHSFHAVKSDDAGNALSIGAVRDEEFWLNAGFFVLNRRIFDHIGAGEELIEQPFGRLIDARKLYVERFDGWWRSMDTFKDKMTFDSIYAEGVGPWELWKR